MCVHYISGVEIKPSSANRSERVDLRITLSAKQTLQRAAAMANKTLSEFLVDSGLDAAYNTLAERRVLMLDDEQWAAFTEVLDAPPADNPRLRALLARKPAWET